MSVPFAAAVPDGFKAFALNSAYKNGDKTVIHMRLVNTLEAGHPYVLHSVAAARLNIAAPDAKVAFTEAQEQADGVTAKTSFRNISGASNLYTVDESGAAALYPGHEIGTFRIYFQIPPELAAPQVELQLEGMATVVSFDLIPADGKVYTLDGRNLGKLTEQQMRDLPRGIYVMDGRKIMLGK